MEIQTLKITMMSLALFCAACSSTLSSNIKTSGIVADYEVTSVGNGWATCVAQFQVGGPTGTFLDLDGGDSVTCNGRRMSRNVDIFNMITYRVDIEESQTEPYQITFNRPDENAYQAVVFLPARIQVTSPANGAYVKKGTSLNASWVPNQDPGTQMRVNLSYSYREGQGTRTLSSSRYDTPPENGIVGWAPTETQVYPAVAGTWAGTVSFERRQYGMMPVGLSGAIRGTETSQRAINLYD